MVATNKLNFDFRLKQIQEVVDGIADAIYYQNALRAQELKGVVLSVGYIRADLEGAAKIIEAQPETAGRTMVGVAPTTRPAVKLPEFKEAWKGFCDKRGGIEINESMDSVIEDFYTYIRQLQA
jgi:predicted TIM-barrel fold metal-dependent hydrolase